MVFVLFTYIYSSRRDTTVVNCSLSIVNLFPLLLSKTDKHNNFYQVEDDFMEPLLEGLKKSELFSDFPEEIVTNCILPHRQVQEYRKEICLIRPQQKVSRFGILLSGKVNIMHIFMEGS